MSATFCSWCDKILDPGDNAETRRRACLSCIEHNPTRFDPLTAEEQSWADGPDDLYINSTGKDY